MAEGQALLASTGRSDDPAAEAQSAFKRSSLMSQDTLRGSSGSSLNAQDSAALSLLRATSTYETAEDILEAVESELDRSPLLTRRFSRAM
jgi:hypothetical protein